MLLFTRIASLGYLFNICVNQKQWYLQITFSVTLMILTAYSCFVTISLRGKHDNKIQFYQHMAYAQGMGRSSIIFISFLLSVDYAIRICAYFNMGKRVVEASICRATFSRDGWAHENYEKVQNLGCYGLPVFILLVSLPFALFTTVRHLKFYARILFYLSCLVLILVIASALMHHDLVQPHVTTKCVK